MSISPFEHPYLSGLFGHEETSRFFSAEEDVKAMLEFESSLAACEADLGIIPKDAAAAIEQGCTSLIVDWNDLREGTATDGVVVPALVRQLRAEVGEDFSEFVHYGATSQDVIDTSLILRLNKIIPLLKSALVSVIDRIETLDTQFGSAELMGRTRMQRALPITVSHRLKNWSSPLVAQAEALETLKPQLLQVQFGGAVGTLNVLNSEGPQVKELLAKRLGLECDPHCWHTDRHALAIFANWLSVTSGGLGKIGQDIVLMAQNEVREIQLKKGGGSSAMPHKSNPVQAELLVTLGRYNATQVSAMHQALIHENERSGASWSLEWMILPHMVMASTAGLKIAEALLSNIQEIGVAK